MPEASEYIFTDLMRKDGDEFARQFLLLANPPEYIFFSVRDKNFNLVTSCYFDIITRTGMDLYFS